MSNELRCRTRYYGSYEIHFYCTLLFDNLSHLSLSTVHCIAADICYVEFLTFSTAVVLVILMLVVYSITHHPLSPSSRHSPT
jgi:hypothetical protein